MESFHSHRGYTLVELLVVLAIIAIISVVVIVGQDSFNKTLILANTAYDVALTLHSAETYGLGGRGGIIGDENTGYGVHFQTTPADSFTLFKDIYPSSATPSTCHPISDAFAPNPVPGNCQYDPSQNERILDYKIGNGITISDFCAYSTVLPMVCAHGTISSLDIVFARPNPTPFIRASDGQLYDSACLTLSSSQGTYRYISVQASGEIIAVAAPCL